MAFHIAFLDTIPWDFDVATPFEQPLGGSQSALCYLAAALAEMGHQVTLVSGTSRPREVLGVTCLNFTKLPIAFWKQTYDALVVVNGSADRGLQLREHVGPATPLVLWAHNAPDHVSLQPLTQRAAVEAWDAIACVSDWHRSALIRQFRIEPERVHVLRNAIAPGFEELLPSAEALVHAKGNRPVLAYTSAPFRGLDVLLDVFPKVHELVPQAEFRVYSSLEIYRLKESGDPFGPLYQRCRTMPGVVYVGSLPQPALAEALLSATILAYPSTFAETSCIVALEAMSVGLHVVTSDLGALPETTMGFGTLVPSASGVHGRAEFASRYLQALVGVLREHARDPEAFTAKRFAQVQAVNAQWTWKRRAEDWERAVAVWREARGRLASTRAPASANRQTAPLQLTSSPARWYSAGPAAVAPPAPPLARKAPESAPPPPSPARQPTTDTNSWLSVTASLHLADWMAQERVSLAFTTNQAGKLLLLGRHPDGRLAMFDRTFARCQGLWADGQRLWMNSHYQLWRFENALRPGDLYQGCDRLYVPRIGFTTSDLDVRDIAVEASGRVVFVNGKFACLSTVNTRFSFAPLWNLPMQPLALRDDSERTHELTGLALAEGRCKYVTATGPGAGLIGQERGGFIVDVVSGKTIATGLSVPHSPRVYRNRLWVLNSGTGYFGSVDDQQGRFEPMTFCPGFLRGLAFVGDYAVVGLSRRSQYPSGSANSAATEKLPLDKELESQGTETSCGIHVIDLRTGAVAHWLRVSGIINELHGVAVLPDVVRPMALGFVSDEIQRLLTAGDESPL